MSATTTERKLARAQRQVALLEEMIETKTREVYEANRELRTAHENLTELHRVLPSAIVVVGNDRRIVDVNPATLELLGRSRDELVGEPVERLCGSKPQDPSQIQEPQNGSTERRECSWLRSDGTAVPVLLSSCTQHDQVDGNVSGVVLVGIDLRERRRMEIELRHAQKLESIGQLAAGIAHEINTPMQFIGDNIQFLSESFDDLLGLLGVYERTIEKLGVPEGEREALAEASQDADMDYLRERVPRAFERTLAGVHRISTIVSAMKAFSHPNTEKMSVDVNKAVETTLTVARSEYKDIADVETNLGAVPFVSGFGGDINQVLLNLVVNAAHAIGSRPTEAKTHGRITVNTKAENDTVVIAISDNGTGIPESIQDRIFEPFFTTKEVGKGTGQGLSLAYSIVVEKHGGSLRYETEAGVGTTFIVRLPAERSAASEEVTA